MTYFGALLAEILVKLKFLQKLCSATFQLIKRCNFYEINQKKLIDSSFEKS